MKKLKYYLTIITLCITSISYALTCYAESVSYQPPSATAPSFTEQININQSTAEQMAKYINGIGISKAKRIVEYREKFGPFVSIEQLKDVPGIGQSILDKNAGKLRL